MADQEDNGTRAEEVQAMCPLCGKRSWTTMPKPMILQQEASPPGFGLRVDATVCDECGFVALLTPAEQGSEH